MDWKIEKKLKRLFVEDIKYMSNMQLVDKLTAKDAMIKPVFLQQDDNIDTILQKLKNEETYTCIVINSKKEFIWEISVEDIIKLFLQQLNKLPLIKHLNRWYKTWIFYKTAIQLIKRHKNFVKEDVNINKVIKLIYKVWFNYIPVVNNQKQVLWVITPSSLINLLKDY